MSQMESNDTKIETLISARNFQARIMMVRIVQKEEMEILEVERENSKEVARMLPFNIKRA